MRTGWMMVAETTEAESRSREVMRAWSVWTTRNRQAAWTLFAYKTTDTISMLWMKVIIITRVLQVSYCNYVDVLTQIK